MYLLVKTRYFEKKYKKVVKGNRLLIKKVKNTFERMINDPFDVSLRTHKVDARIRKKVWSSRISGDIRIIWDFSKKEVQALDLLDIGGHSGRKKVY